MIIHKLFGIEGFGIASLFIKAILGNVTPICFAMLADIVSKKKFRNVLALAIASYSIGIWLPIYFKSSLEGVSDFLFLLAAITIISIVCTILFVKDTIFDGVNFYKNPANIKSFFLFLKKETRLIILFLISQIVAPALFCFFFGEIAYYPTLSSSKNHFHDLYSRFSSKERSVHENASKTHRPPGYRCWSH